MFESLVGFIGPLIEALSKLKIRKSSKKRIGKALAKLYVGLSEIIENGERILQLLEKRQKRIRVDASVLIGLLNAQAERVGAIRSIAEESRLATLLKIHLPQVADLKILLRSKDNRINIFVEEFDFKKRDYFEPVTVDFCVLGSVIDKRRYWHNRPKLVPPNKTLLQKARRDLNKLKRLTDLLRQFLVEKFEIDEII